MGQDGTWQVVTGTCIYVSARRQREQIHTTAISQHIKNEDFEDNINVVHECVSYYKRCGDKFYIMDRLEWGTSFVAVSYVGIKRRHLVLVTLKRSACCFCLKLFRWMWFWSNSLFDEVEGWLGCLVMGFGSAFLGLIGFGVGIGIGILLGFFLFVYSESSEVKVLCVLHLFLVGFFFCFLGLGFFKVVPKLCLLQFGGPKFFLFLTSSSFPIVNFQIGWLLHEIDLLCLCCKFLASFLDSFWCIARLFNEWVQSWFQNLAGS